MCSSVCGALCFVSCWGADRKCNFCIVANCAVIIPHNSREEERNCVSKVVVKTFAIRTLLRLIICERDIIFQM